MNGGGFNIFRGLGIAAVMGVFALFTGCGASAYSSTTVVRTQASSPYADEVDHQADEFIGTPIMGDYDNDENLDFVLEVDDGEKVFKVEVHETAGGGNRELLENVRRKVNAMEDAGTIRVIGYYSSEYRGSTKEYGFLDLKMIAFYDTESGQEVAYFTDPEDSPYYAESDVTVIYAPGHHYSTIHYPRYVSPWWDHDGDGIPNRYDPWPYSYDTWYDYNMNYIPDWYDPYYVGYYPYWDHWHLDFWVGYNWYSPRYYHRGYSTMVYYNDYRTYTRLYDRKYVNVRKDRPYSNPSVARLDKRGERVWRDAYERDRSEGRTTRVASGTPGSRAYRGYESRPVDNRVLVDPATRKRGGSSADSRDRVVASSSGNNDVTNNRDTFTRNRVTSDNTSNRTRGTGVTRVANTDKVKTGTTGTRNREDRAVITSRNRANTATTSSRSGNRAVRRGSEGRTYSPSSGSRDRATVRSGRTTTSNSGSDSRTYRPSSRSRSGSAAVRGSSSTRSSSSSRVRSSGTRTAGSRSSGSVSRARSSNRSSSSAVRSSGSRSRSAPAARSSSSSSRSRGSSKSSSSSSSRSRSRN